MNEVGSNAASSAIGQTRASAKQAAASPGKLVRDPEMDEDQEDAAAEGEEGVDVDPDAMAYIKSRQDVLKLRQARKN